MGVRKKRISHVHLWMNTLIECHLIDFEAAVPVHVAHAWKLKKRGEETAFASKRSMINFRFTLLFRWSHCGLFFPEEPNRLTFVADSTHKILTSYIINRDILIDAWENDFWCARIETVYLILTMSASCFKTLRLLPASGGINVRLYKWNGSYRLTKLKREGNKKSHHMRGRS